MKPLFTLGWALFCSSLFAQQPVATADFKSLVKSSEQHYISTVLDRNAYVAKLQKPTTERQRLIAQSLYAGATLSDSAFFKYNSLLRGSEYKFAPWDLYMRYRHHLYVGNDIVPHAYQSVSTYNVLADTISSYRPATGLYMQSVAYYNDLQQYDSFYNAYLFGGDTTRFRCRIAYNADATIDSVSDDFESSDGVYTPAEIIVYTYEDDRSIADTTYSAGGTGFLRAADYRYNTAGKVDTIGVYYDYGTITLNTFVAFDYYPAGNVKTAKTYHLIGSTYSLHRSDSFGYTSGFDYPSFYEGVNGITVPAELEGNRFRYYITGSALPDSFVTEEFEGTADWAFTAASHFTYNSFGNPQKIATRRAGSATNWVAYFHYETYDDGLSISMPKNLSTTVYPNPAKGQLNVACAEAGVFDVNIVDVSGRHLVKTRINGSGQLNTIDVSKLPAGVYGLVLEGKAQYGFNKFTIIK